MNTRENAGITDAQPNKHSICRMKGSLKLRSVHPLVKCGIYLSRLAPISVSSFGANRKDVCPVRYLFSDVVFADFSKSSAIRGYIQEYSKP